MMLIILSRLKHLILHLVHSFLIAGAEIEQKYIGPIQQFTSELLACK